MSAHARLSPSAASGWMTCPAYPRMNEGLPDETSEFAAEGTFAHEISDFCLTLGMEPFDFIGQRSVTEGFEFEWDDDDADQLYPGLEWVREQSEGGKFYGEHRVDLSNWLGDNQFGTLDRGIVRPDLIIISDLKWGRGIPVSPVRNKQLQIYALGFWWNVARHVSAATDFLIHIDQPRCQGGGGEWRTTLNELLAFGEQAKAAALLTHDPAAPCVASADGCLWCKRRSAPGGCDTFAEYQLDLVGQSFDDLDSEDAPELPSLLTPARRSFVLRHRKLFERWLDDLHEHCLNDALAGNPTDGLKAVEGRKSPDKWTEKDAAEAVLLAILGDKSFTKKLITPTQCGKMVSSEQAVEIRKLVTVGEKKTVLVPEEDAREAITPHDAKFDEEDEG